MDSQLTDLMGGHLPSPVMLDQCFSTPLAIRPPPPAPTSPLKTLSF